MLMFCRKYYPSKLIILQLKFSSPIGESQEGKWGLSSPLHSLHKLEGLKTNTKQPQVSALRARVEIALWLRIIE